MPDIVRDNASAEVEERVKEVNIDIYEVGNRSYVDEPSEFTIQVIHPRVATINPAGHLGHLNAEGNASALMDAKSLEEVASSHQRMYIGVAVGVIVLLGVMVLLIGAFFWRRKRRCQRDSTVKPGTEETEFQYFSYSNDGFREMNTMSADRKGIKSQP